MYTDSHAHPYDLFRKTGLMPELADDQCVCASAHDRDEFLWHEAFARLNPGRVRLSFGIHPQKPEAVEIPFLEELARTGRIDAVGECGFDFFSDAYRSTARGSSSMRERPCISCSPTRNGSRGFRPWRSTAGRDQRPKRNRF